MGRAARTRHHDVIAHLATVRAQSDGKRVTESVRVHKNVWWTSAIDADFHNKPDKGLVVDVGLFFAHVQGPKPLIF